VLIQWDRLGVVGDTSSWVEDTGMVDKHADKGPALDTHTVVVVDQRGLLVGHGDQDAGHKVGRSWNKANSSYGTDQDMVGISVPGRCDMDAAGLKPNCNTNPNMDQRHSRWATGVVA
jgi:hypothetical protein